MHSLTRYFSSSTAKQYTVKVFKLVPCNCTICTLLLHLKKLYCGCCRYVTRLCYIADDDLLVSASGVCTDLVSLLLVC